MPLVFRRLKGKAVGTRKLEGRITDLSYGGMFVRSAVALQALDDICFSLSLSMMGRELTEIYAKVLRVVPQPDGQFGYPVEFTAIESKAQQSIKEFVDGIVEMLHG